MRSSTSFAILALLATAGSSFGAPVHLRDNLQRDDQITNARVGNDNVLNGKPTNIGPLPDLDKPLNAHSADTIHPVTGQKNPALVNVIPITDDQHLKDDKVAVLPNDKPVSGKDGIVDVQQGNLAGHVIQTPGKDKTIADVQVGDGNPAHTTDVRVNLPVDGPVGGLSGTAGSNDQAGTLVSQLVGKPGKGPKQIVGLDPLAEVNFEGHSKPPTPHPSSSKAASHPSSSSKPPPKASSSKPAPARSSTPAISSSKPANVAPSSSVSARPAHSNAPSHGHQSVSHNHSSAPHSSAPSPKPSQSSKANNDGDNDGGFLGGGSFKPTRPGKDNGGKEDHHDQGGDKGGKGPNRINNNGDGHVIGVSSSTRRGMKPIDLKIAQVQIGNLPQHVRPCDTYRHGANGELVDACIEADLLAYAPKHTFRCPDELQHEIHIHEDTGKDATLNTKLGKEIAKYVRLCVDVGAL